MNDVLHFLTELNRNNHKEWFDQNRGRYEKARNQMLSATGLLVQEVARFDEDPGLLDPKDCLFRIYRDVRFAKDKQPYKTHFGSYIARGGRKSTRAGYYLHIEPGASFASGGIYLPAADALKALRTEIFDRPDDFSALINAPAFKKLFPAIEGEKLRMAPKGFPKDFEAIELLKYKSYAFATSFTDEEVVGSDFREKVLAVFRELYPVNRFFNEALDKWQ